MGFFAHLLKVSFLCSPPSYGRELCVPSLCVLCVNNLFLKSISEDAKTVSCLCGKRFRRCGNCFLPVRKAFPTMRKPFPAYAESISEDAKTVFCLCGKHFGGCENRFQRPEKHFLPTPVFQRLTNND